MHADFQLNPRLGCVGVTKLTFQGENEAGKKEICLVPFDIDDWKKSGKSIEDYFPIINFEDFNLKSAADTDTLEQKVNN